MIEKIALPAYAGSLRGNFLPVRDHLSHFDVTGKRDQGVDMIRHQEREMHVPVPARDSKLKRVEEFTSEPFKT